MPNKKGSSRIKNEDQYEALIEKGASKQKAARIANSPDSGKKGGSSKKYEKWTKENLYEKAKQVGIDGRGSMSKKELINALRNS
jgi:hypothetical protein